MKQLIKSLIGLLLMLFCIIGLASCNDQDGQNDHDRHAIWTCSMHPQIQQEKKGSCPICGMHLIPVETEPQAPSSHLQLSEDAARLAEVELSPVVRRFATEQLRLTGKLMVDETRLETISSWFPGRIEKLFIDYTGLTVEKNTHMAIVYSPELQVAQKELREAIRSKSPDLIKSSREKLRLWGLDQKQISSIEKTKKLTDTLTLRSPIGGTILKKYVNEGEYLNTGSKIYDIANLDRLWLIADVYEADAAKLTFGQDLEFTTLTYPGEVFHGTITFISPIVDTNTRSIRIRAIVENENKKLKPEMLAKVTVAIQTSDHGPKQNQDISKLWVCPMHPEEFSKNKEKCSVCGMDMKRSTQLGLYSESKKANKPLLIPATAPLITGKRAIVYVQSPQDSGRYEGREIQLGLRVGDFYIVKHGLDEGDMVVTRGNFKIDSSMQIHAKTSMMQSPGAKVMHGHSH